MRMLRLMQNNSNDVPKMLGLTKAEWIALYENANWTTEVVATCRDIATCEDASAKDRLDAIGMWGDLIQAGLTQDADRSFPSFAVKTQISLMRGIRAFSESTREICADRMRAAKTTMNTVGQLLSSGENGLPAELEEALKGIFGPAPGPKTPENAN